MASLLWCPLLNKGARHVLRVYKLAMRSYSSIPRWMSAPQHTTRLCKPSPKKQQKAHSFGDSHQSFPSQFE